MNKLRTSYLLIVVVFLSFLIMTVFNTISEVSDIRAYMREREMPALGIAAYSRLNSTAAHYKMVGENLLKDDYIRNWITGGEEDVDQLTSFMSEVRDGCGLLDASLVSDLSETYYGTDGRILKLSPDNIVRDGWYYHYRENVGESNIDSWYYPETGNIGLWVNIPVRDNNGRYIGVTGGGVDSDVFDRQLKAFEHDWELSIYMVRTDGRLVYSTDRRFLEPPEKAVDDIWGEPVLDRLSREKQNPDGIVILTGEGRGPVLWSGYMPEWETFLIIERSAEAMAAEVHSSMLSALIPESLLAVALFIFSFAVMRYMSLRAESSVKTERKILHRFQSVIYLQNNLLKKAETELRGGEKDQQRRSLRAGREALKMMLSSDSSGYGRVQVNVHEIISDLLLEKSSDFRRRGINLHSRFSSTQFIVAGNDALFGLVFEVLIDKAAASAADESEIVFLSRDRQSSVVVDIAFSHKKGIPADFDISPILPVLDTLNIRFSTEQTSRDNYIFHLEF